jgi:hypothetical protein
MLANFSFCHILTGQSGLARGGFVNLTIKSTAAGSGSHNKISKKTDWQPVGDEMVAILYYLLFQ